MKTYFTTLLFTCLLLSSFAQSGTLLLDQTINIAGTTREYHLYVPNNPVNAPVVMLFHGHSVSNDEVIGISGPPAPTAPYKVWLDIADQEDLILAIPNGLYVSDSSKGWNDCRSDAPTNSQADDVLFISNLIDTLVGDYQADSDRIYANGTSNGGHFCIRLAQELPEKIAAFASIVAANAGNSECLSATLPISALIMNGTTDPILPHGGGQMAFNRGEVFSADSTVQYWVNRNGANSTPIVTNLPNTNTGDNCQVVKYEYLNGNNNTCVVYYEVVGGGHSEPSIQERYGNLFIAIFGNQNGDIEMAQEVWSFFENKTNVIMSTEEASPESQVIVYPNPATDEVQIALREVAAELKQIVLLNAMGQVIRSFDGRNRRIDLKGIAPGLYILNLEFEGGIVSKRMVVE